MEILYYKDIGREKWDDYCKQLSTVTFRHVSDRIQYDMEYAVNYNPVNSSFLLLNDIKPVAVVPLCMEEKSDKSAKNISVAGTHNVAPAIAVNISYDEQEKTLKKVFAIIDDICRENNCVKASFRLDALANPEASNKLLNFNYLLKFEYTDSSTLSQIINLDMPLEKIWSGVSKGHKYSIRQGEKYYQFDVYDKSNISGEIFDIYRVMHHHAAGRVTRSKKTFELMNEWINNGFAILGVARYNGVNIGSILLTTYNGGAYYGSGAEEPDVELPAPVGHGLQWAVIKYLKANGIKYYETGEQRYGDLLYEKCSNKDINISLYKRGFGGYTVPVFRGFKEY